MNKNKASCSRQLDDKDDHSCSPTDKRERRRSDRRERDRRESDKTRDDSDSNLSNPQDNMSLQNGASLAWVSMGYPMVGMNVIMDPNLMTMNNYGEDCIVSSYLKHNNIYSTVQV